MRLFQLTSVNLMCFVAFFEVRTEDNCQWMPDGSKICERGDDEHNVWTEKIEDDDLLLNGAGKTDSAQNVYVAPGLVAKMLSTAFKHQLTQLSASQAGNLVNVPPEIIVTAAIGAFNILDRNDDGFLEYVELLSDQIDFNTGKLQDAFNEYPEGKVSIFEGLDMLQQTGDDTVLKPLLSPFKKLTYLPTGSAKKMIQGSVQMFLDADVNNDSRLTKAEFKTGMKKVQEKMKAERNPGANADDDQLDALFKLIDKDEDEILSYIEFQGTIPEKPNTMRDSMEQIFNAADINNDGSLSEAEFVSFMKAKGKAEKIKSETLDKEISEGFVALDENHDGSISRAELVGMLDAMKTAQKKRIEEAFSAFDKNGDGFLTKNEMTEIVEGMKKVNGQNIDENMFMAMLDKNHDKQISLEEMSDMLETLMK